MAGRCVWVGPHLSTFNCSSCALGYETAGADNKTCVKPTFRPHKDWVANYSRLQLRDTRGTAAETDAATVNTTGTLVLHAGHTYTIPAPQLEPKERKFAGYVPSRSESYCARASTCGRPLNTNARTRS